jgi:hypothetical protein
MIKSSIIFSGAYKTKFEMKDAHKTSTGGKKNCQITRMTVSVLMEQDEVGCLTTSFYLKKETGPGYENPFSQRAAKTNNIKVKLITFGMLYSGIKQYEKRSALVSK